MQLRQALCMSECFHCFWNWTAGGLGLRQALTVQAQRALIRSGSKRAEALEALTAQVADLQQTLQVFAHPCCILSSCIGLCPFASCCCVIKLCCLFGRASDHITPHPQPCYSVEYRTIPYHIITYQSIPYRTVLYHIIPYRTKQDQANNV